MGLLGGSKCGDCGGKNGEHKRNCTALTEGSGKTGYRDGKPRRGDAGFARAKQKSDDMYSREQQRKQRKRGDYSTRPNLGDIAVGDAIVSLPGGGYRVKPANELTALERKSGKTSIREELGGYH